MGKGEDRAMARFEGFRLGLGRAIEDARAAAWAATRREDDRGMIPVDWLVGHVERLQELDRAAALAERGTSA